MGDCDEEHHVIIAVHHVVKALGSTRNLSPDLRKILGDLDAHLSMVTIHAVNEAGESETSGVENRLRSAREKVISLQSNRSVIWDSDPQEASEYIQAVEEISRLTQSLENLLSSRNGKERELLNEAHNILDIAMARLVEELIYILTQNRQSSEPDDAAASFRSCEYNNFYALSVVSIEDDSGEDISQMPSSGTDSEVLAADLVHPKAVADIKCIANIMFASNYGQEFCEAFIRYWRNELDEYLSILGIRMMVKMEWDFLIRKTKRWCRAMKFVIRYFLASEKRLFNQIFGNLGLGSSACFFEASKAHLMYLLNFGQAIAVGPCEVERLPSLIDMYEAVENLVPDIDVLFAEEVGSLLRIKFSELLSRLGDSVKATFLEFQNQVASNPSTVAFPNGGIHHITKYVMNFINLLVESNETLNLLLKDQNCKCWGPDVDAGEGQSCLTAHHFCSLTSLLERNLDSKSNLYKDDSLKHIFMMNNIHYMVKKVEKNTKLATCFGEQWIKMHIAKFQQHATSYRRATWGPVLDLLGDDGKERKVVHKDRCRDFGIKFEEVYKNQTGWSVPDAELRDDLRVSTSHILIQAYRAFFSKISKINVEKNIKYTPDDLESYILDLFEGSSISLSRRRRDLNQ